ncbi:MAG: pyridoxal phosphate-dependent aminotransferase [candidate division Zixibacteria bacterium]|nr:pyridoxal phosphate-dependent aminotransferase [candidate division Zixibacteria bacterium]
MRLAEKMSRLGTETAFEVLARAKLLEAKGKDIIHLEIGEPDFDTPKNIIEAGIQALKDGYTHYNPSAGLPEFREVIAKEISKTRKIEVNPDQVVVTPGAKPIMFFCIMALANEGEEIIYPNPGFPIYESVINFIGAKAVPIQLREENDFRLDTDELKKLVTDKTRMIIINSPQNPTGGILTQDDLKVIADIAISKDVFVLSDEIYSRIIYEGDHHSISSFPGMQERTIILDGFSKTYAMTGWRLGYGVMREDLAVLIARLQTNSNSCTATFTQRAGIEGLTGPQDEVDRMVAEFKRRRDVIVEGLNAIPKVSCKTPKGAFYVFPNVKRIGWEAKKLADFLLNEAGVAVLSGVSFGKYGEGYIRISYANSVENIKEGLSRIEKALQNIK